MASNEDELPRNTTAPPLLGADLSNYSIGELEEHCAALVDEIERLRAAIETKRAALNAADSVFRS